MINMSIKIPAPRHQRSKPFILRLLSACPQGFLIVAIFLSAGFFIPTVDVLADPSQMNIVERADQLPKAVQRMRQAILRAAWSGEIDNLREVLQMNELMPLIDGKFIHDPVKHWKSAANGHGGSEILALFTRLLELPPRKKTSKNGTLYIWPYFAGTSLQKLAPPQIVQLYRLAPAQKATLMLKNNRYSYGFVTIGADGTWHGFGRSFE